jgi:hypothetical protein
VIKHGVTSNIYTKYRENLVCAISSRHLRIMLKHECLTLQTIYFSCVEVYHTPTDSCCLFVLIGLLTLKKDFNINGIRLRLVLWCLTSLDTICLSYRGVTEGGNRIHR